MFPVVIKSINQAFKVLKSFGGGEWEGDYRPAAPQALKEILEKQMQKTFNFLRFLLNSFANHQLFRFTKITFLKVIKLLA